MFVFMWVVGVYVCDWNPWFIKSCLIHDNERESIVSDLTTIQN